MRVLILLSLLMSSAFPCDVITTHHRYHKSKTSEAKIQLAAAYTAQQSFYGDFGFYAGCFRYMGYDPSNEKQNRLFAIGIKSIEIDPLYREKLLAQNKSHRARLEKCLDEPVSFFPNGKGFNVSRSDLPDDAKVVIDRDGNMTFKIYAIAKGVGDKKMVVSVNQDKIYKIEQLDEVELPNVLVRDFWKHLRGVLLVLLLWNILLLLFWKSLYSKKDGPIIELAGVTVLAFFLYRKKPHAWEILALFFYFQFIIVWAKGKLFEMNKLAAEKEAKLKAENLPEIDLGNT